MTRTITATDGGTATVVASPISIDRTRPHVGVASVRFYGNVPGHAPDSALFTDRLAVGHRLVRPPCHLSGRGLDITTVSYTAIATDRAGSTRRVSGTYRALGIYIDGAAYRHGEFQIHLGRTYTIVVTGTGTNPRYIDASPIPSRLAARTTRSIRSAVAFGWKG